MGITWNQEVPLWPIQQFKFLKEILNFEIFAIMLKEISELSEFFEVEQIMELWQMNWKIRFNI